MNCSCWSAVSLTIPNARSSCSVAKIRLLTRKSGWPMCAPSTAPSMPTAMRRKSFSRILVTPDADSPPESQTTSEAAILPAPCAPGQVCETARAWLFLPECDERLDARCPARRHVRCHARDGEEEGEDGCVGRQVVRRHPEQQRPDQPEEQEGAADT